MGARGGRGRTRRAVGNCRRMSGMPLPADAAEPVADGPRLPYAGGNAGGGASVAAVGAVVTGSDASLTPTATGLVRS